MKYFKIYAIRPAHNLFGGALVLDDEFSHCLFETEGEAAYYALSNGLPVGSFTVLPGWGDFGLIYTTAEMGIR